jgi:hypothetical protein
MSAAYRCEECGIVPDWRIEREGGAVVTWACVDHLHDVCVTLIRSWEAVTKLVVTWRSER